MQDKKDHQSKEQNDDAIARILKIVGKQEPLPEQTKDKWAQSFADEMNRVIANRRRSKQRRWAISGAFAALALMVLVWNSEGLFDPVTVPVAQVVKLIGTTEGADTDGMFEAVHEGYAVAAQHQLRTAYGGYALLTYKGAQVRLKENTEVQFFDDYIWLRSGQIYVATDTDGNLSKQSDETVDIRTDIARVTDIGTQFMVAYDGSALTTLVRDGAIKVSLDKGEYTAHAGVEFARRVSVSQEKEVSVTRDDRVGDDWKWTLLLAARFDIEGRTAYEFLQWATEETGLQLIFDNEQAEANAKRTLLHGDLSAIDPDRAIDLVLETTRLVAQRPNANTLKVYLKSR